MDNLIEPIKMSDLPCGAEAVVKRLDTAGAMRRRLLDIGFLPGTRIKPLFRGMFGGPTAYLVLNTVIALREDTASTVLVALEEAERGERQWA